MNENEPKWQKKLEEQSLTRGKTERTERTEQTEQPQQKTSLLLAISKDQRGASLLLVLFCMTFIGLLATILLTATMSNLRMKLVDTKSKSNFYTAESAVDELKLGLEELAEDCLKQAYTYMLQTYSVTPESERHHVLLRKFVNTLYQNLAKDSAMEESALREPSLLTRYLLSADPSSITIDSSEIRVHRNYTEYSVTIKGVTVSCVNEEGYESTITTDLKITSAFPVNLIGAVNYNGIYYTDYGVIADQFLKKEEAGLATVSGNVYAGEGITVRNPFAELKLQSDQIVSKGKLEVLDRGRLTVLPISKEGKITNAIWAKDLLTSNTFSYNASEYEPVTYLDLSANLYIADDLTMNARKGNVVIQGNYYGYHLSNATISNQDGTPQGSSSISINASESSLSMEEVQTAWIAGKTYLSVPRTYGFSTGESDKTPVMAGESISFKGTQIAYLVPGNCILGVGHNPMTEAEYQNILGNVTGYGIDITKNGREGGIVLENYTDARNPYQAIVVQYQNSSGVNHHMVYLYLKFRNSNAASDYFNEYRKQYQGKIESLARSMKLGTIQLRKTGDVFAIRNTGNVLSYDGTTMQYKVRSDSAGIQIDSRDEYLDGYADIFTAKYQGLISCLDENNNSVSLTDSLAERLIYYQSEEGKGMEGIEEMARRLGNDKVYEKETIGSETEYILVSNSPNETVIAGSNKQGVIIATGDVRVQNATFSGMIITKGNVILGPGGHVRAMPEYSKNLIEQDETLKLFFRDYVSKEGTTGSFGKTIQITYQNWDKE